MILTVIAVCAVILTAAICVAVFYLVGTLKQVRMTAKALEYFLTHADESAQLLSRSAKIISGWVGGMDSGLGRALPFVTGLISAFKGMRGGNGRAE